MNFGVNSSTSVKNLTEVSIRIAFNPWISLGRIAKSPTQSFLALEPKMSHRLFGSSVMFSVHKSYPSLVEFILKYFLIEDAIVNGHLFIVYHL